MCYCCNCPSPVISWFRHCCCFLGKGIIEFLFKRKMEKMGLFDEWWQCNIGLRLFASLLRFPNFSCSITVCKAYFLILPDWFSTWFFGIIVFKSDFPPCCSYIVESLGLGFWLLQVAIATTRSYCIRKNELLLIWKKLLLILRSIF